MKDLWQKLVILWQWEASVFESWRKEIWKRNLDERACCDGRECGCGGASIREMHGLYR